MVSSLFLLLALALTCRASGHGYRTREEPRRCGAPEPSEEQVNAAVELARQEIGERVAFRTETVTVNTYFHVVATSKDEEDGYLSDKTIDAQLRVLNEDYAPANFKFKLLKTTRTVNRTWALDPNPEEEAAMKASLRQGTYSDLNVYFFTDLDKSLGYCGYPKLSPSPAEFIMDGCSISATTLPGSDNKRFNLGKTATHEIGHWMGLFHTFHGGCTDQDAVSDTPAQGTPTDGCPLGKDTCQGGGLDPIHNYMDYSDDPCYREFTPGQVARMHSSWARYRA